ncbi:MAG: disulfide bond formation protein DsbA [Actinobacteria bacterium HGW-Actinobacteria-2]|nr:MAG: disulfide bond formation protein DsbA [Actinobacteria bacterium HGW-Actinobacteria-2]
MSNKKPSGQQPDPASRRQQLRLEQERAAKEAKVRRIISFAALGVLGLAVIGGIVWAVMSMGALTANKPTAAGSVNATYTVVAGDPKAPVVVDIYQDYMCPYCGEFDRVNAADLEALATAGQAQIRLHPMNFLDGASQGTKYSTRAANALVTVAKAEPDKMLAFNTALYTDQPAENTTGLSDAQIAERAKAVGVSDATIATFTQLSNADFVNNTTKAAFADGIESTPTILINGTAFNSKAIYTAGALRQAVEAAAKG